MVSNGECRLLEFERSGNQALNAVGAVEQGVLSMAMQMNEGHMLRIDTGPCA